MADNPLVTLAQLQGVCITAKGRQSCGQFLAPLNAAMQRYEINTPVRIAMFLAQIAHESGDYLRVSEDLRYSAKGLAQIWPSRFAVNPEAKDKVPNARAQQLANRPEAIANAVYGGRFGNGDEASGDGWRYRGAGLKQLTFKANHEGFAKAVGMDLDKVGDYLRTPEGAALSAGWFWNTKKLNPIADSGDYTQVTKTINGALTGQPSRLMYLTRAKQVFNA